MDMDWNTLKVSKRSYIDIVKERLAVADENGEGRPNGFGRFNIILSRKRANQTTKSTSQQAKNNYNAQFVTDHVLRQILLGENLVRGNRPFIPR